MKKWTEDDLNFLKLNYPQRGKIWCAEQLGRKEGSIRAKTSELNLRLDKQSEHWIDFQSRAASSKVGKKRPDQSLVMKQLHKDGKLLKTAIQKEAVSKRIKKWICENGHPRGMLNKNHTQETKDKIAILSKKNYDALTESQKDDRNMKILKTKEKNGNLHLPRPNTTWKSGWRLIGGINKYYRSRWEANYARFLEMMKQQGEIKDWKHEPKTFWFDGIKRGCVSYLPDFWVLDIDGSESYHEVKGWMDERSKTKIKRMAKYHPNVKLVVVASKEYNALKNRVSSVIEDWED